MPDTPATPSSRRRLIRRPACSNLRKLADEWSREACGALSNTLLSETECAGAGSTPKVDLVVLIDTSGSMKDEATGLSNALDAALERAKQTCDDPDLKATFLGVHGTFPGTLFTESHREYLLALAPPDDVTPGELESADGVVGDSEDGAAAIIDIVRHFDWRSGAQQLVFYLGDEGLSLGNEPAADDKTDDDAMRDEAITAAKAAGTRVFTYFGNPTGASPNHTFSSTQDTRNNYKKLAEDTGGVAYAYDPSDPNAVAPFADILTEIICAGAERDCVAVRKPGIQPCFELHWGESQDEPLGVGECQVLCITACNPYSNVTIKDLTIQVADLTCRGSGREEPRIVPNTHICFGDLAPCVRKDGDDEPSCKSRQVVLMTGRDPAKCVLRILSCYEVVFDYVHSDSFVLDIQKG